MNELISDNKRLAINTIILYTKLIITIIVSFVTSRLVLDTLGASDYGLYNVVGGVVTMLNIIGVSMVATSYRYMSVELGKGTCGHPNKVYNTIFIVHAFLAILLIVVGEKLGVYYVNNYLVVADGKIPDALFVLHLSLITTAFAVITVPMNGLIIAREKFLFTSIVETVCALVKIGLVVLLMFTDGNRLRLYAIFLAIVQLITPVAYQIYCRLKENDIVRWNFNSNRKDYQEVLGFAWWILIGSVACIGRTQGAAMIINSFFGTILNAAFGLSNQVSSVVSQFTSTLCQAAIPQIMKSQNGGKGERSIHLVYLISRYSYLLMNILTIPLLLCLDDVLYLWLGDNVPEYTYFFVFYMLVNGMISNLGAGFDASIQATGKIRNNQIGYSILNIALLPIIYVLYKIGFPPYINVMVMVILTFLTLIFQMYLMSRVTVFCIRQYFKVTIIPSFASTTLALLPLFTLRQIWHGDTVMTLAFLFVAVIWTCLSIYLTGVSKAEKTLINTIISTKVLKR